MDETAGPWAMVILLTFAVRGVNLAPDSGLGAGCLVAGSTNRPSWTSSTRWLFASPQARLPCGNGRRSPVEPRMRQLGEPTGRSPDPCLFSS